MTGVRISWLVWSLALAPGCRQLLGIDSPDVVAVPDTPVTPRDVADDVACPQGNCGVLPVNLGAAGSYAILAKAGISGSSATVTGDLGISPAAATLITGFSLTLDPSATFATSTEVIGKVYAADYGAPTPANLTLADRDVTVAVADAGARMPDVSELSAGDLGGLTLAPGVYRWSTKVQFSQAVTLDGAATAVWIFQVAGSLSLTDGTKLELIGGALAKNVFWQVDGAVMIGSGAHLEGVVASTSVTQSAGATLAGRVFAQSVTIDGSTIAAPPD